MSENNNVEFTFDYDDKGYDTMRWTNHYRKLMCDTFESPLEKEFWRVLTTSLTRIGEQ